MSTLLEAKKLADRLGGLKQAKEVIDARATVPLSVALPVALPVAKPILPPHCPPSRSPPQMSSDTLLIL